MGTPPGSSADSPVITTRLNRYHRGTGSIDASRDFHAEHAHLSPAYADGELARTRPNAEYLVLCHGDYCPPKILVDQVRVVGCVDLGELSVADRWWDLAVASWSIGWNFGPGLEEAFFAAYGPTRTSSGSGSIGCCTMSSRDANGRITWGAREEVRVPAVHPNGAIGRGISVTDVDIGFTAAPPLHMRT
jgi:hypothetical protein